MKYFFLILLSFLMITAWIDFPAPSTSTTHAMEKVVIRDPEGTIPDPASFIRNRLGVDVRPATSEEAKRYGLDSREGIVIVGLYPDSPLEGVGFELNDMILEVEGRPVKGLKDLIDQIMGLKRKQKVIMLGLDHRTGRTGFVQVVVH